MYRTKSDDYCLDAVIERFFDTPRLQFGSKTLLVLVKTPCLSNYLHLHGELLTMLISFIYTGDSS